jgi:hypothetical protein
MTQTTISEFLTKHPEAWGQGGYGVSANGRSVSVAHSDASKWCLIGLIYKVYGYAQSSNIREKLEAAMNVPLKQRNIPEWNDAPGRTVQDIITLAKKAGV